MPKSILDSKSPKHYKCLADSCGKTIIGYYDGGKIRLEKAGIEVQCPQCKEKTFIEKTESKDVFDALNFRFSCSNEDCDVIFIFKPSAEITKSDQAETR